MKWNLNSTLGIAMAALLLTLFSVSDANAQSGWDFYSAIFSQPQSSPSLVAPSYQLNAPASSFQTGSLNQTHGQIDFGAYSGGAGVVGSQGYSGQRHLGTHAMFPAEVHGVYGHAQGTVTNLHNQNLAPAVVCQSNT